jgi:hypothetical protein
MQPGSRMYPINCSLRGCSGASLCKRRADWRACNLNGNVSVRVERGHSLIDVLSGADFVPATDGAATTLPRG